MPEKIQSANGASQLNCPIQVDDGSTSTVGLGENNLSDIARTRGIDRETLIAANPHIPGPYAPLSYGQEFQLPFCQAPAQSAEPAPAEPFSNGGPARTSPGDPLPKSVQQANFQKPPELTPDEQAFKARFGEERLRTYKEVKNEFATARRQYLATGKLPPLKYFAPIEIMAGTAMTRSERYDANLLRQGLSPSYPKRDVDVDPAYLTREEFGKEWVSRGSREMQACVDDNTRPGTIERCRVDVKEKYMGKEYMEASWAATRAAWNDGAYIEKIKNSGPLGLAGRVLGRAAGYAISGKEGADKGEEILGTIGDMADLGIAVRDGMNARARINSYNGSAGLEVGRDVPVEIRSEAPVEPPREPAPQTQPESARQPATSRPDASTVVNAAAKASGETLFLSHGTDSPGFRSMGGLGPGRIRVDHSPGAHLDFGSGFYVAVGEGAGVRNAEAFGDLRAAQRGSGPRQVLGWEVKRSDLGDVVDVRPGGEYAEAWKKFLDQPLHPNVKMTIGDFVRGTGVEKRGEYFDKFLQSIGKQNADVVIGPIGTAETSGVVRSQGTQMVIRSQRVADHLNQIMGGTSGPANPGSNPAEPPAPAPGNPKPEPPASSTGANPSGASVWRQGSGTSVHNPKANRQTPAAQAPARPAFSEAEQLVIDSQIRAGKTRAEAEQLVKDMRDPQNKVQWVRPDSANPRGITRGADWKYPGAGKKTP